MDNASFAILRSIYRLQPATRRTLAEATGLGTNRISALVAHLTGTGIVREEVTQDGTPGRPVGSLSLNAGAGWAVGLDIGSEHSRAVVSDLSGHVRSAVVQRTKAVDDPTVILPNIQRLIEEAGARADVPCDSLLALGIGLRGIVDTRTGQVLGWPSAPAWASAWRGLDLRAALASFWGNRTLIVEDSVRAMGATAYRFGAAQGCANFLYVFLGNGIGSALMVSGEPYRGGVGISGELGHITVKEDGDWCSCGNRGCLEVLASTTAVLARVRQRLAETPLISSLREPFDRSMLTLPALHDAALAGDKIAFQILDETGVFIGRVVAVALNLLGPDLVVLGGPLVERDGVILEAVRRQVRLRALQYISSQTRIIADDQGEHSGAQGAAMLALDELFNSPEQLGKLVP